MISIVCVYNDEDTLKSWLLKSLKNQMAKFELIKIDNTQNKYKSAAKALNYGGRQAKGKYIMFVHQDVVLSSDLWLKKAEKILDSIPDLGIAGVIGISEAERNIKARMKNIIKQGEGMQEIGNPIEKPESVQTLDECLVIIPKNVFNRFQFDEKICDTWHLYAVDYSLSIKRFELGVYAIPISIYHRSPGNLLKRHQILCLGPLSNEYYRVLRKLLRKHRKNFNQIYTTCGEGEWRTDLPLIYQRLRWTIKKKVIGRLLRLDTNK